MDIKSFLAVASHLPNDISMLIRGPHGIGKSQVVKQLAERFGLVMIDRRLSQMTEGDMVGLPFKDEVKGATEFMAPDWFVDCVNNPRVIFLDEINRATPEVMQAAFELVLDRSIMGKKVHKDCRIYAAINASAEYQVNDMDPALLDRFYVVDLQPSVDDFLEWGKDNLHPAVVDFIRQNPKHLEHKGAMEPGKVYPSRRSWERVSHAVCKDAVIDTPSSPLFYASAMGLVGVEAAIAFTDFVKNYDAQLTAEDVLDKWSKKLEARVKKLPNDKHNSLIEKLGEWGNVNDLDDKQAQNAAAYMKALPGELRVVLWTKLTDNKRSHANAKTFHKYAKELLLATINATVPAAK